MKTDFIKKIKLPKIAKSHPIAFWAAVVFHLVLVIGLFFSNVQRWEIPKEDPKKAASRTIPKAVTVDLTEIKKEKQRLVDIQKQKTLKIQREEKRLRVLEDERYQKQRKINQLKAKTQKEKQAKELAEEKRKEAEKIAKAAEKKKQEIERLRKVEAKRFKKEQSKRALTKEIQAEEDQDREIAQEDILNELKVNYINQIASRVHNQWRYQGAKDSWGCDVHILQDIDGKVHSVNVQTCNIDNNAKAKSFKNAIERAVYKASPLPPAPDKSVFDREILFHFRVN
jgi:colicin import membrane protein